MEALMIILLLAVLGLQIYVVFFMKKSAGPESLSPTQGSNNQKKITEFEVLSRKKFEAENQDMPKSKADEM